MIDWWMTNVREGDEDAGTEIETAWREAGLVVFPRNWYPEQPPDVFHGVPVADIARRRGGGGAGAGDAAIHVIATIWPLVASGVAGAAGGDAWRAAKTGLKAALRRVLRRRVGSATIAMAQADPVDDLHFEFTRDDLPHLDDAVDAMGFQIASVEPHDGATLRRYRAYEWDAEARRWVLIERWDDYRQRHPTPGAQTATVETDG